MLAFLQCLRCACCSHVFFRNCVEFGLESQMCMCFFAEFVERFDTEHTHPWWTRHVVYASWKWCICILYRERRHHDVRHTFCEPKTFYETHTYVVWDMSLVTKTRLDLKQPSETNTLGIRTAHMVLMQLVHCAYSQCTWLKWASSIVYFDLQ